MKKDILIGNSFPISLLRRKAMIKPFGLEEFKAMLKNANVHSFWGHSNTLRLAEDMLKVSLDTKGIRRAVELNERNLIDFDGVEFKECYVLSPDYKKGYRPALGVETLAEDINSWSLLQITWIE